MLLTNQQMLTYAQNAGFSGANAALMVAIARAESGGDTNARNAGGDRGVLQINSSAHPEISDACAFDAVCSFKAAFKISQGGGNFREWCTAWSDGACGKNGGQYLGHGSPFQQFLGAIPGSPSMGSAPSPTQGGTGNPLQDWVNSIQPAVQWLANPTRIAKLVLGAIFVFLGLALLMFPDQSQQAITSMKAGMENVSKT